MGNYSYMNEQIYTNDIDTFLKKVAPYYSDNLTAIPEQYRNVDEVDVAMIKIGGINTGFLPNITIENNELILDMDGWKIQGYWYDGFCKMLELFHRLGLRGYMDMTEETEQDFVITFTDKQIEVEIWEPAQQEERDGGWITTEHSRDQKSIKTIIKNGEIQ